MNTDKRKPQILWQGLIACVALGLGIGPGQAQAVCDPSTNGNHVDCITGYSGPEVCVDCHQNESRDMHGSVHYQQNGPTDFVTNITGLAGERGLDAGETGINTYCGTHENSPRFTCAGCHVGNGRFPMAQSEFEKLDPNSDEAQRHLANIDCLTCHQELYKRFPDPTAGFEQLTLENVALDANGNLVASPGDVVVRGATPEDRLQGVPAVDPSTQDFQFVPADPTTFPELASLPARFQMPITSLQAAQTVHPTSRQSCLSCHAGAAGADGAKRGDLSRENIAPSKTHDLHMSAEGANLTCSDCHDAGGHRMRGRGLDLRPNDVPERFTCENSGCHSDQPHGDFSARKGKSRDKHAMKVACQTCHIPSYAKANVGTEVARDWQDPHLSQSACNGRGGWLPREDKDALGSASLIPSYAWFDGTSEVYFLGEPLDDVPTVPLSANIASRFVGDFIPGDPAYVLGAPNGDVTGGIDTKLYPMKEHWGKLARNDVTNELIGHSTFEFFRTGSICRAVAVGLGIDEVNASESSVCEGTPGSLEMPADTTMVAVQTYQTINHGVEDEDSALECGACHSSFEGGPVRMNLQGELGFGLRTGASAVQGSRVSGELNGDLDRICSQCHDNESEDRDFRDVHERHVEDERKDCAACHNFSRPERNLLLTRGD